MRAHTHTHICVPIKCLMPYLKKEKPQFTCLLLMFCIPPHTHTHKILLNPNIYILSNYVANALCFQCLDKCFVFFSCSCGLNTSGLRAECLWVVFYTGFSSCCTFPTYEICVRGEEAHTDYLSLLPGNIKRRLMCDANTGSGLYLSQVQFTHGGRQTHLD